MAAYGLYTHIRANRWRSALLLVGLFFLVYVMVFAGALAARAVMYDASFDWYVRRAWGDLIMAAPFATIGTLAWILIAYKFHQSVIDAVTGEERERVRLVSIGVRWKVNADLFADGRFTAEDNDIDDFFTFDAGIRYAF